MSDTPNLPPGVRIDPKRGVHGGKYLLIVCPIYGKVFRESAGNFLPKYRRGIRKACCSSECGGILRRRRSA